MVPLLIEAVKELKAENADLKAKIAESEETKEKVAELESILQTLVAATPAQEKVGGTATEARGFDRPQP